MLDDIVEHARRTAPAECCGLLLGELSDIVEAVPADNIADDPVQRFLIEPKDHIHGRRRARERGLAVVGFYHSHPASPAEPSPTDVAEAAYPDHVYLIVSLVADAPEVALFRFEGGNFHRLAFVRVG
ncbi:MAG TPA: M67 family metallopeptidase [Vicinamibacterales bacterium]|nr:M67 family metallopeptidase [Vicinamibacterales bacterium]